ncbi:MAG: hypothetical protein EOP53_24910, partial [Sphingobacteriales bacterium]
VANLNGAGDIACLEFPFETDNKKYWFEARLVPFYKKQILAFLRDITDRKTMQEKLEKEKQKQQESNQLLEAIKDAIPSKKHENFSPDAEPKIEQLLEQIQEYNILNEKLTYEINLRRGMESTLKMHLAELQKRNKELEHFRYLASNDFQEPLRHITSFAKILSAKYKSKLDENATEMLDFMIAGGENMQQIILNLSDYTSIEKTSVHEEAMHMEDVVIIAKRNLQKKLNEKNAHIFFDELPVITGYKQQLAVLFENLFDNALKYSHPAVQPEILIGAEEYPSHYEFYVKDNGIGFNMDFHDRIFMLFQRLHPRSQYCGAGIGLAFCKKIVEQHGGEIWAESVPGEGSTFYFTIPK